jgi:hypothetical protein
MVLEATDDKISFFKQYFSVIILIANVAVFVWQMMDPYYYYYYYEHVVLFCNN